MITNVNKSGCLNSTVDYVYRKDKDPMVLNANFCRSDKLGALGELREAINEKPHIKEPVWHAMLSLDKGEHLTNEQWQQATDEYIEKMGFSNCPFVVVKHHDTEHEHVHIIASRVSYDRQLVSDSFDYPRSQVAARDLEARFNLRSVPNSWDVGTRAQQQSEYNLTRRTGMQSSRSVMIDALRDSSKKQGVHSVVDLKRQLDAQHIKMVPKTTRDQSKIVGVYFEHKGVRIPGSKLHKSFGWNRLRDRFEFDAKRDQDVLLNRRPMPPVQSAKAHAQPSVSLPSVPAQKPIPPSVSEAVIRGQIAKGLSGADWDNGFDAWSKSLKAKGIDAVPKVTQGDPQKITGMYFEYQGMRVTGSSVHKQFGFQGIQTRLGGYAPGRDFGAFEHVMVPGVGKCAINDLRTPEEPPKQSLEKPIYRPPKPVLNKANVCQRHQDVQAHSMLKRFVGEGVLDAKQWTASEFAELQRQTKQPWAMASQVRAGQWTVMGKDLQCKDGRYTVMVNEKHQAILLPYRRDVEAVRHQDVELKQSLQIRPILEQEKTYPINPMPEALEQYKPKPSPATDDKQTPPKPRPNLPTFEQRAEQIRQGNGWRIEHLKDGQFVRGTITKKDMHVQEGQYTLIEQPQQKLAIAIPRAILDRSISKDVDSLRGKQITVLRKGNDIQVNVPEQDRGMSR